MPRLKVAFVHPDLGIGGAERLVLDVATALRQHHKEIVFLTNHFDENHAFEEVKRGDFEVQVLGDWLPRHIFGKCQALCAYIRMIYLTLVFCLCYNKDIDVFFVDLIPVAVPILKFFNQKVVYYCHHPDLLASDHGSTLKKWYRKPIDFLEVKSTKCSDVILVNSEYTGEIFRETFPEITKPIQIIYPTVAFSFLEAVKKCTSPRKMDEILSEIPRNGINLLSINRFHPAKGLELVINAMEILQKNISSDNWNKITLILAGGYDPQSAFNVQYFHDLKALVQEKNLQTKIIFLKSPSDDLKTELLLACDCLIYTPIKEHFGIVPLEAMTVSKPVIACNSGGPRETIEHGTNGFLTEPNPENLSQHIADILQSDREKMGAAGKTILEKKFSFNIFSKNINRIIDSL